MTTEPLSSNVVNYLVWRYLQEAGYGNAALQLSRCWNRDPEALPFAKNVSQHALINLLQDGLWFDKLQAEAGNGQQRFHFGRDHGRPYSVRNGNLLTLDQGIPAYQLAGEASGAVQEPPPSRKAPAKRKKGPKPNGIEPRMNTQVNGDAMDVDQNGNTHVTNSVRAESEAIASEADSPTVAEIPISTLSIGQSTEIQTEEPEVPADLAPNTGFSCSVKDPGKKVTQTLWGTPDAPILLAAGESLLRLYLIPKSTESTPPPAVQTLDLNLPLNDFAITALCWNSHREVTVSAREERKNELGEIMKTDRLFKLIEGGTDYQVVSSTAGLVTTLRWNEEKQLLLAISSDGVKGSIKIWKDPGDEQFPVWTAFTEKIILDAIWISDSSFVICGIEIFHVYTIGEQLEREQEIETSIHWESLKHDPNSGIVAAMGIEGTKSHLGILHPNKPGQLQTTDYPEEYFTDLDFRPVTKYTPPRSPDTPVLLATCAVSGAARIWDANIPFKSLKRLPLPDDSGTNKIAFSPDGSLLAAAGFEAVTVWEIDKRDVPLATWRAQDLSHGQWDASVDGEFSLGWDPDGTRLSITAGNQIAVIPIPR